MVVVFLAFITSTEVFLKLMGVGMATAILVDATIVRMVLVPAVMQLLDVPTGGSLAGSIGCFPYGRRTRSRGRLTAALPRREPSVEGSRRRRLQQRGGAGGKAAPPKLQRSQRSLEQAPVDDQGGGVRPSRARVALYGADDFHPSPTGTY